MKKDTRIMIGTAFFLLAAAAFFLFWKQSAVSGQYQEAEMVQLDETLSETSYAAGQPEATEASDSQECAVYIAGAVKNPGLYRYSGQARLSDAIDAVGGFTKNAAAEAVNLAQFLNDGEQITVPTKKEAAGKKDASQTGETTENSGLININTATSEELMTLPGIGEAKAALILEYRQEHGSFAQTEDIMKISGIKEGIYNTIKDLITI